MKSTSLVLRTLVILGVATLPAPAIADPIAITSGFLSSAGLSNIGTYQLNGRGLSLGGNTDMGSVPASSCFPCPGGTVVPLSTLLVGRLETQGPVIVDGAPFSGFLEASFEFNAPALVMSFAAADISVRRPFTFSGVLRGTDEFGQSTLFERMLIGQGELTANFALNPNLDPTAFEFRSIRYDFADAAPVPEPITMLLVGTGLGGVFVRHRNRRRLAG
jgi:hypothetical protein